MQSGDAAQIWRVIGGGEKGGIVVRIGEEVSSDLANERLATGAIIKELEQKAERLHYRKLCGRGPAEGWVSLTLQSGKALVRPMPNLWLVVGGVGGGSGGSGGILVRAGSGVTSEELPQRLKPGSLVEEEGQELLGSLQRLQYRLLFGQGPPSGWVSVAVQQKALILCLLAILLSGASF